MKTSPASDTTPDTSPVRLRHPPEVRRRMLLEAARSVIAERGLHATTLRDVAAAGEVAVGTVTYHFSGMAEVLAGVLDAEMAEYSAPIMQAAGHATTGLEALQHIVDGLLADGNRARRHWRLWLDFWALSAHDPRYARWQSAVYDELHALVSASMRRGADDGSLSTVADPDRTAVDFVALLDGLVVQCYLPTPRIEPAQARARMLAATELRPPRPAASLRSQR